MQHSTILCKFVHNIISCDSITQYNVKFALYNFFQYKTQQFIGLNTIYQASIRSQ